MARNNHYEDDEAERVIIERHSAGVGSFLAGLAIGAGLALLLAPQTGEDFRRQIRRSARKARSAAEDFTHDLRDRAEDVIQEARTELSHRVGDAREAVNRKKREFTKAVEAGRAAARDTRESLERRIAEARTEIRSEGEAAAD
jgi:gas vesicle protein